MPQGRKAEMIPYGNGCKLYPDCFTCPLPDCVWLHGMNREAQKGLVRLETPYFEHLARVGKEQIMNAERG